MNDMLRERLIDRYVQALDEGDLDTADEVVHAAMDDRELVQMIAEANRVYEEEQGLTPSPEDVALSRDLLERLLHEKQTVRPGEAVQIEQRVEPPAHLRLVRRISSIAAILLIGALLWSVYDGPATYDQASLEPYEGELSALASNYRTFFRSGTRSFADSNDPEEPARDSIRAALSRSIDLLLSARRGGFLGLFHRYDPETVDAAVSGLKSAYEDLKALKEARVGQPNELEDEPKRALVAFLLAKAYLMQGNVPEAQHWLKVILSLETPHYKEAARDLLDRLS